MQQRILVTGAAGFAGSHLVDLLERQGARVTGWHRPGRELHERPLVRFEAVDSLDRERVRAAVRRLRPTRVYHCAGAAHVGHAWDATRATLASNVLGTHHLIEALRDEVPDARILIPSSALVYAPSDRPIAEDRVTVPSSPYGLSKLAQEMLAEGGVPPTVCVARPFNHFGPRQDPSFASAGFARRIAQIEAGLADPVISVGNLQPRRDLCDVRDTVRAYVLIMERGAHGRPYNVCSGRAIAVSDLLEALLLRAKVSIRVVADPSRFRPNDQPVVVGDPSRIRHELGWVPLVPFEQTVDDLLTYWREDVGAS